jgi:hypothetical protein
MEIGRGGEGTSDETWDDALRGGYGDAVGVRGFDFREGGEAARGGGEVAGATSEEHGCD